MVARHAARGDARARDVRDAHRETLKQESAIFERWLGGDERAFRAFFERTAPLVLGVARRHGLPDAEARDLLQQTFLGVYRSSIDFRRGAPVRPWLITIARNVLRDHLRRRYARREVTLELDGRIDPRVEAAEYGMSDAETLVRWVRVAVARLPAAHRRVIELHFFDERSFSEVASAVGCTEGAARVRAHRGYEKLREWLADPDTAEGWVTGADEPASSRR